MNDKLEHTNLTSDLLNDISWDYIYEDCTTKGVDQTSLYRESILYKDIEEQAISCFLNNPELLTTTILEDKHFINYQMGLLFKYFKKFYEIYHNLDITIMLNRAKDKSKLYCLFKLITDYNNGFKSEFSTIEKELIEKYRLSKVKEELIKTIYGNCTIEDFKNNIKEI
ncbi:MAG: hypothetical protein RR923_06885 [Bacilli bacterium]